MTEAEKIAEEIVVFNGPYGYVSNDMRWHDPAVRDAWTKREARLNGEDPEEEEEVEEEELASYEELTNDELRAELSRRKLSVNGKKEEMVARLEADDEKAVA